MRSIHSELGLSMEVSGPEERARMTLQDRVSQLFSESRLEIYRYAVCMGMTTAEAQETTQEAFLRLFLELQKGERIDNERAWLFRVAHNLAINARLRNNRVTPLSAELTDLIADSRQGPEASLLETDQQKRLRQAINGLSPQQRQCLQLRAEGLRYREIANIIGITTSSVSEFVRRGISRLRSARHE